MSTELAASLVAIVVLLVLSGFFSGSETALTAASRARMNHLQRTGVLRARLVLRLVARRERLIGAILLGNNLVNILASALATGVLIGLVGDAGIVYATIAMTALVVVFSEVLPKSYALHNAERVSLAVAPLMVVVVTLLAPVVSVVRVIVGITLRLFGVQIEGRGGLVSPHDELKGAADLHAREGRMVKTDRDMLAGLLELSDVEVGEIMVHRRNMIMIDAGRPAGEIVAAVLGCPHTRVPIWRDDADNIVGILHVKDVLRGLSEHGMEGLDVIAVAREPWYVPETTTLREQLNAFRERREHIALVVDEYGALMGLVTLEDILEEIVGDIADEHDIAHAGIREQPDGSYLVEGAVTVRDLNRHCEWQLPDDEAATVAGLVINEARRIPEVGESFELRGFSFEVMRRQRNRIASLRIRPPRSEESSD